MMNRRAFAQRLAASVPALVALSSVAHDVHAKQAGQQAPPPPPRPGGRGQFDGSPVGDPLPGQKWRAHDRSRPQPRKVVPGQPIPTPSAPSDAIVLFDGKDLSQWGGGGRGGITEPRWKVENGYVELVPGGGSLVTKESFGDVQLHLEWMTPTGADASRVGQFRGNSGVIFMGQYEVQVLSSYDNPTYPDGGAGGIYGLYPPMVNPCLPEGQWNTFDFVFEAPVFEQDKVVKRACITLFFNGLVVHNRAELLGATSVLPLATYKPHAAELPLTLQGHAGPARYRNIWIRRLKGYDA
jgi:hypothetical protein